ncbi:hypothetical protein CD110_07590 [Staphylococcus casei]|uniref:Staphylococcal protein n=1 Tax=Staphylococcus casei TaxID=201828 RepID=A0ABZ2WBP2_9STAP|nr:hypothetical protein [Staphylococcus casei]OEL02252.1 hypothetical protein AST12_07360 [Staphylococcus succinus]PNZ59381.1 hypothetical protein CD110_07590 [Staphylococcus casei]PTI37651.1 hypothetical protein BU056_12335 [Staphylococcus succinus]WJE87626.1 hypothetical protein QMO72_06700 [Staphylococcus casei]
MNIGIIIFVISVIVTIIGAINDKSHKERQNQKPPVNKQPNNRGERPEKRGFLEEIGKTFKEIEKQMNEGPTMKEERPAQPTKPAETRVEKMETPEPRTSQRTSQRTTRTDNQTEAEKEKMSKQQQNSELQRQLEADLVGKLQNVRTEIDRENEKKLQRTERKARAIIADKNLSERTKRYRLKQLMNAHAIQSSGTNERLRFDKDEVVNGIIWSEILDRPKRL